MATGSGADIAKMAPGVEVEQISLQAHFDQLEAAIDAAHEKLDRIQPRVGDEGQPAAEGAQAAAIRCGHKLAELNQRLINVADLVGTL